MVKAVQIAQTEYPELSYIIDGLIPYGLSSLAGRPKVGKSWLALQMAYAVSTGQTVLGKQSTQGNVLYLSLEDNERRIKSRMIKQGWDFSLNPDVDFETTWNRFNKQGSIDNLFEKILKENILLTIVDTISRALPHGNNGDEKMLGDVYDRLQKFCLETNRSILLNDHHRKPKGDSGQDGIDDIWGATAKGAILDAYMAIYRTRQKASAKLCVGGRDIEENEFDMTFDRDTAIWQIKTSSVLTTVETDILSLIFSNPGITNKQLTELSGKQKSNISVIIKTLIEEKCIYYQQEGSEKHYFITQNGQSFLMLEG